MRMKTFLDRSREGDKQQTQPLHSVKDLYVSIYR